MSSATGTPHPPSSSTANADTAPTSTIASSTAATAQAQAQAQAQATPADPSIQQQEDAYFSTNPPPRQLPAHAARAEAFIAQHARAGRRVVLITSGGTTVPLERQTVRFIDNFSAGTRGATSAEYFLAAGYAVIFLHRQFSLLPYSRHYSHSTGCFLDFLDLEGGDDDEDDEARDDERDGGGGGPGAGRVRVRAEDEARMRIVLRQYRRARRRDTLLMLPFVTIGDYLHELRALSRLMRPLGPSGLLYLAAAVSDFFVPPERMSEHKIQSTNAVAQPPQPPQPSQPQAAAPTTTTPSNTTQTGHGDRHRDGDETFDNFDAPPRVPASRSLVIDLDPVPKFLKSLVDGWTHESMIVSYKLETDPAILVRKARYSLDRYQHHLVIGNLLSTRKWEVVFVSPGRDDRWLRVGRSGGWGDAEGRPLTAAELPSDEPKSELESLIIPAVQELHSAHMQAASKPSSSLI